MRPLLSNNPGVLQRIVEGAYDPAAVIVTFAPLPSPFALESVCNTSGYGRYSIFGCKPVREFDVDATGASADPEDALAALAAAIGRPTPFGTELPFAGGWVGYIPYELGAALEGVRRSSAASDGRPRMRFALYDAAIVHDHVSGTWQIVALDMPHSTRPAGERIEELAALLELSASADMPDLAAPPASPGAMPTPNMSKREYLAKVNRAIRYIEAGDIYQVNLTQRFTTRTPLSPLELYLRLRRTNPAAYAAYLPWGAQAVLSSSPELFLDLWPDGRVITRPIKGTRPRSGNPKIDVAREAELLSSGKDRAELNMIIDLLRNDLGKVCAFGTVRVLADHDIECHPTVLHLVASIEGRLRAGIEPADLLRATLPGGSITGCPKIRAMQIINELEPTPRDVYCGSIGYIGLDGRMSMNIAIRTMLWDKGLLHIYAGGAITSDSDPEAEYREMLAKAEGMFRALGRSTNELAARGQRATT